MKYLYGASIQGIQEFLFETDKLKEISGASDLVDNICTGFFKEILEKSSGFNSSNLIIGAAGNIKYLFEDEEQCRKFVYDFPKKVMQMAPGITVSQALVKIEGEFNQDHIQKLEANLKVQRNKPVVQHGMGLMVSERARKTGKPGVKRDGDEVLDNAQVVKRNQADEAYQRLLSIFLPDKTERPIRRFSMEMEEIAGKSDKWIAVIHADGNDLGRKITQLAGENASMSSFRMLSEKISKATENAVRMAFDRAVEVNANDKVFPFRPIIIGGDDITVVVRGRYAINFTKIFLEEFENETKKEFADFPNSAFSTGLTACAGVAFIKPSYPFHYAVHLAEELCKSAKNTAKGFGYENTPSCLLFHRVHSSFIESYPEIIKKELTAGGFLQNTNNGVKEKNSIPENQANSNEIRLDYGPYFLKALEGYETIGQLQSWASNLAEKKSPKSRLRNWLTQLHYNQEAAQREFQRILKFTDSKYINSLDLRNVPYNRNGVKHIHLYDAIILSSIQNG